MSSAAKCLSLFWHFISTMQASVLRDLLECKQLLEKEVGREGPSLQRVADVLEMVERVSTSKTHGYTLMTVELLEQTKLGHLLNKRVRKLEGVGEGSVVAVLVKSLLAKWKKAAACGGFLATKKQEQATVRAPKASPTARSCHRYAITFGEQAILHVGGEEMGDGRRETGYSVTELQDIAVRINAAPATAEAVAPEAAAGGGSDPAGTVGKPRAEVVMLHRVLPESLRDLPENQAACLLIRDGAALLTGRPDGADLLLHEQQTTEYDRKFWNSRQKKTQNKRARYNVVFGNEAQTHNSDYSKCTVHAYESLPQLRQLREAMPGVLGDAAAGLNAEGNHYYEEKSGIGFHGDAERKVVVCLSLGAPSTLRYHWRFPKSSEHTLPSVDVSVSHGDVYVMSEKATGFDWMMRSKLRLVHGAGSAKYIDASKRGPNRDLLSLC